MKIFILFIAAGLFMSAAVPCNAAVTADEARRIAEKAVGGAKLGEPLTQQWQGAAPGRARIRTNSEPTKKNTFALPWIEIRGYLSPSHFHHRI